MMKAKELVNALIKTLSQRTPYPRTVIVPLVEEFGIDKAVVLLTEAIELGYSDPQHMLSTTRLDTTE